MGSAARRSPQKSAARSSSIPITRSCIFKEPAMGFAFVNRHPLEDHLAGFEVGPNPNHLAVVRNPAIFSVLAHAGHEDWAYAALSAMSDVSVRRSAPGEWLVVSETLPAESLARDLAALDAA